MEMQMKKKKKTAKFYISINMNLIM